VLLVTAVYGCFEIKLHLCEAAEKLANEEDIISAFHQLQKLHQEFRDTGPVAKELREEIWTRFKTASTTVNRRHQQHFEALKEKDLACKAMTSCVLFSQSWKVVNVSYSIVSTISQITVFSSKLRCSFSFKASKCCW